MSARPSRRPAEAPRNGPRAAAAKAVVAVAAPAQAMALYEQVKDHISRKIQEGIWRAGDRLPSENELVT
ncbi:MAG: GntR family transcriptional regulator, partial [Acidovorax sp.]